MKKGRMNRERHTYKKINGKIEPLRPEQKALSFKKNKAVPKH